MQTSHSSDHFISLSLSPEVRDQTLRDVALTKEVMGPDDAAQVRGTMGGTGIRHNVATGHNLKEYQEFGVWVFDSHARPLRVQEGTVFNL